METWKPVVGAGGEYEVSDQGRVRSLSRVLTREPSAYRPNLKTRTLHGRVLRPGASKSGHVTVVVGRARGSRLVHHLVLEAFVGLCPPGLEALHKNGRPADNRLSNLRWGTRSDNLKMDYAAGVRDRMRLGRWKTANARTY